MTSYTVAKLPSPSFLPISYSSENLAGLCRFDCSVLSVPFIAHAPCLFSAVSGKKLEVRESQCVGRAMGDELYLELYFATRDRHRTDYVRFVVSHGELRYTNAAGSDETIRKSVMLGEAVVAELERVIRHSEVLQCDDRDWVRPDSEGSQELEVRLGRHHVKLKTRHLASAGKISDASLKCFFYATQDLKSLLLNLIAVHYKRRPL